MEKDTQPPCFGNLEKVFPMGSDGLRHAPAECMDCEYKTPCLRRAVAKGGKTAIHYERTERAYQSGAAGFFSRWSARKAYFRDQERKKSQESK